MHGVVIELAKERARRQEHRDRDTRQARLDAAARVIAEGLRLAGHDGRALVGALLRRLG